MVKFGFAIVGLLSAAIVNLINFMPDSLEQPEGAVIIIKRPFNTNILH